MSRMGGHLFGAIRIGMLAGGRNGQRRAGAFTPERRGKRICWGMSAGIRSGIWDLALIITPGGYYLIFFYGIRYCRTPLRMLERWRWRHIDLVSCTTASRITPAGLRAVHVAGAVESSGVRETSPSPSADQAGLLILLDAQ